MRVYRWRSIRESRSLGAFCRSFSSTIWDELWYSAPLVTVPSLRAVFLPDYLLHTIIFCCHHDCMDLKLCYVLSLSNVVLDCSAWVWIPARKQTVFHHPYSVSSLPLFVGFNLIFRFIRYIEWKFFACFVFVFHFAPKRRLYGMWAVTMPFVFYRLRE